MSRSNSSKCPVELTFEARHWQEIAKQKLQPGMFSVIMDGVAHAMNPTETLTFEVTFEERDVIRKAASKAGVYRELGIADPTKETQP